MHPVLKNGLISLGGFGVTGILGYIFQFFISRRLSVAGYGEFQSLVALLSILGVGSAALSYFITAYTAVFAHEKDFSANQQFLKRIQRRLTPLLLSLFMGLLLLSFVFYRALHLESIWSAIIISLAATLSISTVVYTGTFAGWQNFFAVNTITATGSALKLLAGFAIVTFYPSANSATLVLFISIMGTWFLARFWSRRVFALDDPASSGFARPAHLARDIGFITAFTLLILFLQNADVLLVRHLASPEISGHYSALNLLGKIILWANLGIAATVLPLAFAHHHAGTTLAPRIRYLAYLLIGLINAGAVGVYFLLPNLVIALSVGQKYAASAPLLGTIGLMNALLSVTTLEANFAFARRDRAILYILLAAAALFTVILLFSPITIAAVTKAGVAAFASAAIAALYINLKKL